MSYHYYNYPKFNYRRNYYDDEKEEKDDFKGFINAFYENMQNVTNKTIKMTTGHENEEETGNICWMVSENIREMLSINDPVDMIGDSSGISGWVTSPEKLSSFIIRNLEKNRLLDIAQIDHYFIAIGDNTDPDIVHLVEWGPNLCHVNETMSKESFVNYMIDLMLGNVSDRFHGRKMPQFEKIMAFDRKIMTPQVVEDYIETSF